MFRKTETILITKIDLFLLPMVVPRRLFRLGCIPRDTIENCRDRRPACRKRVCIACFLGCFQGFGDGISVYLVWIVHGMAP